MGFGEGKDVCRPYPYRCGVTSRYQQKHKICGKAHQNVPSGDKWIWNRIERPENATILSKYQESDRMIDICGPPDTAPAFFRDILRN